MTAWPTPAAAAIVLGLVLSPLAASAPTAAAAGEPAPVSVTMIAALTAPERTTGFISSDLLESYTGEFGLLTRQLDQLIDRPIALGIDPAIIASIRILGTSAPESATAWLARLETATNETFPLTWADADLSLALQAGSDDLLAPGSFAFAINPALFAAEDSQEPEPTATATADPTADPGTEEPPTGGTPPLPTDESLVAWNYTVSSIVWPAMNAVVASDLDVLGEAFDTTILSSDNVGSTTAVRALVDGASVLIANASLSTRFSETVATTPGANWELAMAELATAVATVPSTLDRPASVLIALGRDVPTSDTDLGVTIDTLATSPSVQTARLADIVTSPAVGTTLVDRPHDQASVDAVAELLTLERGDASFVVIAEDPSRIIAQRRLQLLSTISAGWADSPVGWQAAIRAFTDASATLRDSVKIVKTSSITLWADRASLPVTISNDLNQAVTVYVTVRPLTPLLKVENSFVAITVEPRSQRKAQIPVQSLSNGTVQLEVSLHRSSGISVGDTTYVSTVVQAGWETPVTIGFAIAVVLVFAAGIVRTIVRRRRARADES